MLGRIHKRLTMAGPVTIADIYALFQTSQAEADRRLQRLERVAANTSREVAGLTTRWGSLSKILSRQR